MPDRQIRVAIAGVGNCAAALVQGLHHYSTLPSRHRALPGIAHEIIGPYRLDDIAILAAFDVHRDKVGRDLSEAVLVSPNCAPRLAQVPRLGVTVQKAPVLDGLGEKLQEVVPVDPDQSPVDIARTLRETKIEILLNLIPTGSTEATAFFAEQALCAGCGLINAIPEPLATDPSWQSRFQEAGLPLAGDDLKSQLGATIIHRLLLDLFAKRGVRLLSTYQMNAGGSPDFHNLTDQRRAASKLASKTSALRSLISDPVPIHVDVSNHVPFLAATKIAYIHLEGSIFGGTPASIDLRLAVDDSPNAAGVLVDLIRLMKLSLDAGIAGPLHDVCAYYFKSPPDPCPDDEAWRRLFRFLKPFMP